ncbi:MAG: hypothetical protein ACHQK9_04835 [Reyranellales bacterium]
MFYFLTVVAAIAGVLFGYDEGVIAVALPTIEKDFPMSALVGGFMTAAVVVDAAAMTAIWVVVVFTFPAMLAGPGLTVTFAIFAAICLGGAACTVLRLPEPTNHSLEAIEAHVMSGRPRVKL